MRLSDQLYDNGCEALVQAVVKQAKDDYYFALKLLDRNSKSASGKDAVKELRKFFLSEWFTTLTNLDGKVVLAELDRQYKKKRKRTKQKTQTSKRPVTARAIKGVHIKTGKEIVFDSVASASMELHISTSALRSALSGESRYSGNHYWSYIEL